MLERLTIAIVAVLLVAALVLAIRYDIERTAASKPSALGEASFHSRPVLGHHRCAKLVGCEVEARRDLPDGAFLMLRGSA